MCVLLEKCHFGQKLIILGEIGRVNSEEGNLER